LRSLSLVVSTREGDLPVERPSLRGCDAKVERAREHLKTLYKEIDAFIESEPHEIVSEFDAETLTRIVRLRVLREPDETAWAVLLGDFLHNLRSALDHLVWQLVLLNGAEPGAHNQFPISSRRDTYWRAKKDGAPSVRDHRLRGVAEAHRRVIDEVQPYRRGADAQKDPLAILRQLSNVDKHQVLHAALIAVVEPNPDAFAAEGDERGVAEFEFNSGPLEDGAEVLRIRVRSDNPNAHVHVKAPISMGIGFGEQAVNAHVLPNLLGQVGLIVNTLRPEFSHSPS
jgi:hypothetical protein